MASSFLHPAHFPNHQPHTKTLKFSAALQGEDVLSVRVVCSRGRPRSSSHFRVCDQCNDCSLPRLPLKRAVEFLRATVSELQSSKRFTASLLSEEKHFPRVSKIRTIHFVDVRNISPYTFLSTYNAFGIHSKILQLHFSSSEGRPMGCSLYFSEVACWLSLQTSKCVLLRWLHTIIK